MKKSAIENIFLTTLLGLGLGVTAYNAPAAMQKFQQTKTMVNHSVAAVEHMVPVLAVN